MLANALRAHLAELGHVANPGIGNLAKLAEQVMAGGNGLPSYARTALEILIRQIMAVSAEITELDQQLATWHSESEASRRLAAIPGLGIITATAIAALARPLADRANQGLPRASACRPRYLRTEPAHQFQDRSPCHCWQSSGRRRLHRRVLRAIYFRVPGGTRSR